MRDRIIRVALAVFVFLASLYFAWRGPNRTVSRTRTADFPCFYAATRAWLQGSDPYDKENLTSIVRGAGGTNVDVPPSLNPPPTFPLLTPFVLTDWPVAIRVWAWAQAGIMAATLLLLVRVAGWSLSQTESLMFIALALLLAPTHTCISLGQLGVLTTFFVAVGLSAAIRQRDWLEGASLVLASAIKPHIGLLFLVFALLRFRWRVWVSASAIGGVLLAISVGQLWAHHVDWTASLQHNYMACFSPGGMNDPADRHSYLLLNLQYPLSMVLPSSAIAAWVALALTTPLGAFTWFTQRGPRDARGTILTYSIAAVLTLLAVYNRYFNASPLVLPLLWAIMSLKTADRAVGIVTLSLLAPFLVVSGTSLLEAMVGGRVIPATIRTTWWWDLIVIPHQVYILLVLAAWLVFVAATKSRGQLSATSGDGSVQAKLRAVGGRG